jgi:hypothetical protein
MSTRLEVLEAEALKLTDSERASLATRMPRSKRLGRPKWSGASQPLNEAKYKIFR